MFCAVAVETLSRSFAAAPRDLFKRPVEMVQAGSRAVAL
jgi:hypothetical protein